MAISDKLVAAAMKNLEKLLISKGLTPDGMISKFDFDGDGEINLEEFDSGLEQLTGSRAPRSYLQPIFSAIDQDGSGKINSNELMALLGIENETVDSSPSLIISNHVKDKYNGEYFVQPSKINSKPWYLNSNNCRLYFYNANEGGAPSWSLDDREQDGSNDWYGGGWTRVPADGNIPLGTRRFVGAGKINISLGEQLDQPKANQEAIREDNINQEMDENDMISKANEWTLELGKMLENPESNQNIDSIKADFDSRFEDEISQLPLIAQAPARAIWKIKSDALVTVAKTKLSSDNAKIISGLAVAGAAVGAVSAINKSDEKDVNDVELVPEDGISSEEELLTQSIDSSSKTSQTNTSSDDGVSQQNNASEIVEEIPVEVSDGESSPNMEISLNEIIYQMNEARFLNDQKDLISKFNGIIYDLSFRVNSIDRTFGIGISDDFKKGNTIHATFDSHDIEVRLKNDYDTSKIMKGNEISMKLSVEAWNGIRKRLILNSV